MGTISVSLPADGTTADVADHNTPITTIVNEINGNLDNDNIKSAAGIAGSKLADDGITAAKLEFGVVRNIQTGGATDWSSSGTTNTDKSAVSAFWQLGTNTGSGGVDKAITFPTAYTQIPHVQVCTAGAAAANAWTEIVSVTTTTLTIRQIDASGATASERFNWLAVGV